MKPWVNIGNLNKCPVYRINSNNSISSKFILFGPDLSRFKEFLDIEDLVEYAVSHGLILEFKNDS